MSDFDDAIRRDVHQQLDLLEVPTAGRAATVQGDFQRSRRRRALTLVTTAAVAVSVVATTLVVTNRHSNHVEEPAGRLRIVRTLSASSLDLAAPQAVAIGPNGNLYITDSVHQRVTEATPTGKVVRIFGGEGTGPGRFRMANGEIAVDHQGRVYVADSGNGRIQVFTSSGQFIRQMGALGRGAGKFEFPTELAVAPDGSVYVGDGSDNGRTTLTKLSPTGLQDWRLGGPNLVGHTHFADLDSHGRLVAASEDTSRIVYISPQGQEIDTFGHAASRDHRSDFPHGACDTTVDSEDYVYVAGCAPTKTGNLIQVYDPTHRLVAVWHHSPLISAPRFGPGGFAVAVGSDSILELATDR